jgi:ketosteroid isomerase-like protein
VTRTPVDTVLAVLDAYRAQDRDAVEPLLADDLVFTSPYDDHLDRAAYLERCFPTADRFRWQEVLAAVPDGETGVFLLYEYELHSGARHRNTEYLTVQQGRVRQIQVFFGGQVRGTEPPRP